MGVPPGPMRNLLTLDQPQWRSLEKESGDWGSVASQGRRRWHHHCSSHPIICICINNWGKLDTVLHRAHPAGGRCGRGQWKEETGMGGWITSFFAELLQAGRKHSVCEQFCKSKQWDIPSSPFLFPSFPRFLGFVKAEWIPLQQHSYSAFTVV